MKIIFQIWCVLAMILPASTAFCQTVEAIADQIRPSLVTVMLNSYDGKGKVGSGFFLNEKGEILTNDHVIPSGMTAQIKTWDQKRYRTTYTVKRMKYKDFLQVGTTMPKNQIKPLKIAENLPRVGEKVVVAGSPMGLEQTISSGIVSAWRKHETLGDVFQMSAPVSPGSSGGPVLNMEGEVVGIVSFQCIKGQNLNFAIPVRDLVSGKGTTQKHTDFKITKGKDGVIVIE